MNVLMELSKAMVERKSGNDLTMVMLRVMMMMQGMNPPAAAKPEAKPEPAKA